MLALGAGLDTRQAMRDGVTEYGPVREGLYAMLED